MAKLIQCFRFKNKIKFKKKKEFCFLAIGLSNGLKIFRKPYCKQIRCHPGFVVLFREHRQKKFSIILRGPRILGMVNEH